MFASNLYFIFVVIIDLFGLFLISLVFSANKKKRLNHVFVLMTLGILCWITFAFLSDLSSQRENALLWNRLIFGSLVIVFVSSYFFSFLFPKQSKRYPIVDKIVLLVGLVALFLSPFSSLIVKEIAFKAWGTDLVFGSGIFLFYLLTLLWCFSVYALFKKYRRAVGMERLQIWYLWLGLFLFLLMNLIFNVILPAIRGTYELYQIGNFSVVFFLGLTAYAVIRHRLMGIRFAIRKGTIYTLSAIIAFVIYTTMVFIVRGLFTEITSTNVYLLNSLAIIVIAISFEPLRRGVRKLVDIWFFPESKKIEKSLAKIKEELPKTVDFDKFARALSDEIGKIIPVKEIKFFLLNKQEGIYHQIFPEKEGIKLRLDHPLIKYILSRKGMVVREELPLLAENKSKVEKEEVEKIVSEMEKNNWLVALSIGFEQANGLLFLAAKENKDAYTSEDLKFLENLKFQASQALDNAILYKEAVERIKV